MLYSEDAIQTLVDRVGWAPPVPPATIGVTDAVTTSTSGRYADGFHQYATVENVYACMPNGSSETDGLINQLLKIRKQSVLKVLSSVFKNKRAVYRSDTLSNVRWNIADFSGMIYANEGLFDDYIGYQIAWDTLELIATSVRTNAEASILRLSVGALRTEQNGVRDNGEIVVYGLAQFLANAKAEVLDVLFPAERSKNVLRDASHKW